MNERDWLDAWFTERNKTEVSEDLFENIDSFGVIEMILDIEKHFSIRFTELDFQDRKFSTIEGLSEIIRGKRV